MCSYRQSLRQKTKGSGDIKVSGEIEGFPFKEGNENQIVVELKSVQNTVEAHEVQLVNYLNGLKKDIGLLINFGPYGVEARRKYRKHAQEGMDTTIDK